MKKLLWIIIFCLVGITSFSAENLIENGDFENKTRKWDGDLDDEVIDENGVAVVELEESQDTILWQRVELDDDTFELEVKLKYKPGMDYKGRGFRILFERPDTSYTYRDIAVKQNHAWQDVEWKFTNIKKAARMKFRIEVRPGEGTIYFDDVRIVAK